MKKIAILDRDGTICEEVGYITSSEAPLRVLPASAEAIKWMNDHGWTVVGASNQSGVARGYTTEAMVNALNQRLIDSLAAQGARIEKIYFCPHHPLEACMCRKPRPGMVRQILRDYQAAADHCVMVGDKDCDVEMAEAVGMTSVLVMTGYGETTRTQPTGTVIPDHTAPDLLAAAKWIVANAGPAKRGAVRPEPARG